MATNHGRRRGREACPEAGAVPETGLGPGVGVRPREAVPPVRARIPAARRGIKDGTPQVAAKEAREDVVCPNGHQNILVISSPRRENADRYAAVERIDVRGTAYEVSTYESALYGTVKGVIRGIHLEDTAMDIQQQVVQDYNPTALQANRIGRSRWTPTKRRFEIKGADKERRRSPAQPLPIAITGARRRQRPAGVLLLKDRAERQPPLGEGGERGVRRAGQFEAAERAQGQRGVGTGTAFEVMGTAWRTRISNQKDYN
ncbi:hypothetical protein HPB48_016848 [Haemaphysalis longicornis]|uniref:Uncharacterized protein n=1 Tax=Haemaphysalis longicornis TaxID=44386 RepID=A0A9J6FHD8_HAELO|nr:hypothetical protein HPB48_016848 [Haemaphysalis longicornis]